MALLCNTKMDLDGLIPLWHTAVMKKGVAPNKIRELRLLKGWSQQQLADAIEPPTTQPQIDRLEKGERKLTQTWMGAVSKALNLQPQDLFPDSQSEREKPLVDNTQRTVVDSEPKQLRLAPGDPVSAWPRDLRVLGFVKAGKVGYYPDNGETLEMTERPPMLAGVPDSQCYAVYIDDVSMIPALKPGYIAWVHARRPATPGDNIIIQLKDGQAFVKELVRRTEKFLVCKQWNPEEEVKYDQTKVGAVHLVVGTGKGIR